MKEIYMENYSKMYYYLFNRITDLIEQMKVIQQEAEEMYLSRDIQLSDSCVENFSRSWYIKRRDIPSFSFAAK